MDPLREAYVKDPRIACKYGTKCYQKNSVHHEKYKHPPKKTNNIDKVENAAKKFKPSESPPKKIKEISSSDEDEINEKMDLNKNTEEDVISDVQRAKEDLNNSDDLFFDMDDFEKADPLNKTSETISENHHCITDSREFIKSKFLFEMPEDFYQFYDFCLEINKKDPLNALIDIGLKLVGPFDVLAGKFNNISKTDEEYLLHWRYFYDPPGFQTVLKGNDKIGYHIGYYRDNPEQNPVFLVENKGCVDGILNVIGDNIFAAVNIYLDEKVADPFTKLKIKNLASKLKSKAENLNLSLGRKTKSITERNKKVLATTFNKAGLVVPYVRRTQLGYRKLIMSNKDLDQLLSNLQHSKTDEEKNKYLSELQELLTATDIASDECDFGTAVELGLDMICHGVDCINRTISRVLSSNYRLLKWEPFAKIIEAHMANRKKGSNLSIL